MSYATKANAAAIAGVAVTDIADYQVTSADRYVELILGRSFESASQTDYYDIKGDEKIIQLHRYPVISITTFRDNQRESSYTDLVEDTDFTLDKEAGLVKLIHDEFNILKGSTSLTKGEKTVKIVYTWGYASVPNDVAMFADWVLARMAEIKKSGDAAETSTGAALKSIQIGDYEEAYDTKNDKIDKKYKAILAEMTSAMISKYKLWGEGGDYHVLV